MAKILIAGCGDVGQALGLRLVDAGHEAWGLRRRIEALPGSIRPVAADLGDPSTLTDLPADLDAVVYAAAADASTEEAYRRAYVDGPQNVLAALEDQGQGDWGGKLRRFIFTSSTSVYGQSDGSWVDETSPTEPKRFTGRIIREAEAWLEGHPIPTTSVRFGGIYGPGRTRLIRLVQSGEATVDRQNVAYTNRIHRDDCAGILHHLIERDLAGESVDDLYVGVDDEPAPRHEVFDWLADRLGVDRVASASAPSGGRLHGGSKRCRNARIVSTGYHFQFPSFREGYAALLEDT